MSIVLSQTAELLRNPFVATYDEVYYTAVYLWDCTAEIQTLIRAELHSATRDGKKSANTPNRSMLDCAVCITSADRDFCRYIYCLSAAYLARPVTERQRPIGDEQLAVPDVWCRLCLLPGWRNTQRSGSTATDWFLEKRLELETLVRALVGRNERPSTHISWYWHKYV